MSRMGQGAEPIAEAVVKTVTAADAASGRFLVIDPNVRDLDSAAAEKLREFYRTYGFEDLEESTSR